MISQTIGISSIYELPLIDMSSRHWKNIHYKTVHFILIQLSDVKQLEFLLKGLYYIIFMKNTNLSSTIVFDQL